MVNSEQDIQSLVRDSLTNSYIFRSASDETIAGLMQIAELRNVKKGESLFLEGENTDEIYVLVSGLMTFLMHDGDGKRYVLGLVDDHSIFGEMEVFTGTKRVSHAEAHENCQVLVFKADEFVNIVKEDNEVLFRIIKFYAGLLSRLTRFSLFRDIEKQLAWILLDLARRYGKKVSIETEEGQIQGLEIAVSLSQEFLGAMMGVPRQRINTTLKGWEAKAWIKVKYNKVILLNEAELKSYSII